MSISTPIPISMPIPIAIATATAIAIPLPLPHRSKLCQFQYLYVELILLKQIQCFTAQMKEENKMIYLIQKSLKKIELMQFESNLD